MKRVFCINPAVLSTAFKWLGHWQSVTVCLLICTALSCQQNEQEVILESSPQLITEDGILKFSSSDAYEKLLQNPKLLDDLLVKEDFQSLKAVSRSGRIVQKDGRSSDGKKEVPETLAKLLNKDGVYQIGQWVIKLDFRAEKVFVLKNENKSSLYNDLVAGRVSKKVWQFTFDDEVLDLLNNGYEGSPQNKPGGRPAIFCGGGISDDPDSDIRSESYKCSPTTADSQNYNIIEYSKYGTYFECDLKWGGLSNRLASILPFEAVPLGGCEHVGTIDKKYFYETNCRNSWTGSAESYGVQYSLPINTYGDDLSAASKYDGRERIYQGSRGLRCLRVELFRTTNGAGVTLTNQLIRGC